MEDYDFSGWATRNDLRCSDGRTIRQNAFEGNDGQMVPLVWNHQHNDPNNVLGHAILENRSDGVYAYGYFNDTPLGRNAKELVRHGDVTDLSIYANELKQIGGDVLNGNIREVSLVLAGANPGAYIENVLAHGSDTVLENEAILYGGFGLELRHSYEKTVTEPKTKEESAKKETGNGKTVEDIINSMNDDQIKVLGFLITKAREQKKKK